MKIDILTDNPDIIAVATCQEVPGELVRTWSAGATRGRLPEFSPMLAASIRLLELDPVVGYMRIAWGCNTIVVQREHGYIVAACIPTGHPVSKSLHRMIRRAVKPATVRVKKEPRPSEEVKDV